MTTDDELGDRIRRLAAQLPTRQPEAVPAAEPRTHRLPVLIGIGIAACTVAVAIAVFVNRADAPRISTSPPVPAAFSTPDDPTTAAPTAVTAPPTSTVAPPDTSSTSTPTTAAPTTTTITPTTTTTSTATTAMPIDLSAVTMPIIDLEGCMPTWGRERPPGLQVDNLFARPSSLPIAVQVLGSPSGSMLQPFVLVERFFADQRIPVGFIGDDQINGSGARIEWNEGTGHGGLSWLLPDGSEAYLRTASLSREQVLDLARALIPRPTDASVPGFDLPTAPPFGVTIIDETYGALESSAMVQSQCEFPDGRWLGVSLIDPGVLWRAALILDRSSALPLVLRDLTDGRLLFITGRPDSSTYMQGIAEHIRGATPAEQAALLTYPAPGELNPWELPVDEEAHDRLANRTFANTDEISAAVISILQERVPALDAPETQFTAIQLSAHSELVITMNYLDDSVVAAQWLVRYQGPPGALNVYAVHQAIKCRDGSAHPPDYAECP